MSYALQNKMLDTNCEVLIAGLGDTGLSVATFLDNHRIPFAVVDTRSGPPLLKTFKQKFPNVEIYLEELSLDRFRTAKQVILSPGIDIKNEIIQSAISGGIDCIGDIELFANNTQIPVVAITGSNGKSTVTSLVADMATEAGIRAYAGGNLGPPALDLLNFQDAELYVLELSSFQLESTKSLSPSVAAVLNISEDHLDRHGDIQSYAHIKSKIFNRAKHSIVNRDDKFVVNMQTSGSVLRFGLSQPDNEEFGLVHIDDKAYLAKGEKCLIATDEITLQGESGILNSLAALAVGDALGIPQDKMVTTLTKFKGLPHRFSLVGVSNEVAWFNDSKGTNIGATISSLRGLEENIVLLAGGIFKGGDLGLLHEAVKRHVKHVILFGHDAKLLGDALNGAATIHQAASMRDAVTIANSLAQKGDNVLLSPACASFDMYENYAARGEDYELCVKELVL